MKNKTRIFICSLAIMGMFLLLTNSCKKDDNNNNNTGAVPVLTTSTISDITTTTANCGGNITSDGGSAIIARGVCWGIVANPTIANSKTTDGAGTGSFISALTGLIANTTYYIRAYATSSAGTGYGSSKTFITTSDLIPVLTTSTVSDITANTATCGGIVISDGGSAVIARGVCWSLGSTPTIADNKTTNGTGTGMFTSALTGLIVNTTYYIRAYATNNTGTGYGSAVSFTTKALLIPVLTTVPLTTITETTASSGGKITSDGGATITAKGVCWSIASNPTIANNKTSEGTGIDSFISNITGLTSNTIYYMRSYATNSNGTGYGNELRFFTKGASGTLTDPRDGFVYKTITIGTQIWMAENLQWKPSTFVSDWKLYNNIPNFGLVYGALYNSNLVSKATSGLPGWRVPSDDDWKTLVDYLGGNMLAGANLKEETDASPAHWVLPNTGATNSSGFTALGSGYYDLLHSLGFQDLYNVAYFWTTSLYYTDMIIYTLRTSDSQVRQEYGEKSNFYSIRLMKNL